MLFIYSHHKQATVGDKYRYVEVELGGPRFIKVGLAALVELLKLFISGNFILKTHPQPYS